MRKLKLVFPLLTLAFLTGCVKETQKEPLPLVPDELHKDDEEDKPVAEPEPTEEPITEYEVELPEKLSSFAFGIWGEKYVLPMSWEQFEELGWSYRGNLDWELKPETYIEDEVFEQGGCQVRVDLINNSGETKKVNECSIGGITLDLNSGTSMSVNLPSEIVGQQSLKDEVTAVYGAPNDTYEEDGMLYLTYEYGLYRKVMLGFRSEDEVLTLIDLENYRSFGANQPPDKISSEVPEEVTQYQPPEEPGNDFSEAIVRYADVLYRLPAPVQSFLDQKWEVLEEESDAWVGGGSYGYITLAKDGEKVYIVVYNYSEETMEVKNCFVTTLYGDLDTTKVPIEVAGGVRLGMSEAEFLEAAGEQKAEQSQEDGKIIYTYYMSEDKKDYTEISVDSKLKLVRGIKVVHNRQELLEDEQQESESTGENAPETQEDKEEE